MVFLLAPEIAWIYDLHLILLPNDTQLQWNFPKIPIGKLQEPSFQARPFADNPAMAQEQCVILALFVY
jgi:hypothetical protein